ncbi:DUF2093 domain-containing protein [Marinicaulis flavus]|uniref:DUF2093 domain-containing protein n=1 Tax=Hyphococcus luteus TaxID=2058213 RepID=A0A2S7K3M0_9PROT|nr:DUF2093 domain-containing protein [Marinicaulis flavus]PQA87081.1 DUF2093 domain-containing protein [Marinicaulis flavus]
MNPFDSFGPDDEAVLDYDDAEFHVVKPGAYVVCAVTGARISLKALRYWNVDKQEPYADAAAAMKGFGLKGHAE